MVFDLQLKKHTHTLYVKIIQAAPKFGSKSY